MSKKIEIPLEKKVISFVPIKFPQKCVTCGAPAQQTLAETIHRKYQIGVRGNEAVFEEHDLNPIHVPYCEEHYRAINKTDKQGKRLINKSLYPSLVVAVIVSFVLFFKPIYAWSSTPSKPSHTFYVPGGGPVTGLIFTIFILLVISVVLGFCFTWLIGAVFQGIKNPPRGLKTYGEKNLQFTFTNDLIAYEFMGLNKDLGARIFSSGQAFREIWEDAQKTTKNKL